MKRDIKLSNSDAKLPRGERRENENKGVEERGKGEWNTPMKPSVCWGPFFLLHSHMLSFGRVTLLDLDFSGELSLELNIGPSSPMASSVFLGLQNG